MNRSVTAILLALCCFLVSTDSFSPAIHKRIAMVPVSARTMPPLPRTGYASALRMAEGEGESKGGKKSEDGTYYDDEVEPAVKKPALSDSMRAKLMAEANSGLDPDRKQTNVLLYIMAVVALLVLLGGQGILY